MKRIHLLRTTLTAGDVAGLVAEARAEGLRLGWLDLSDAAPEPSGSGEPFDSLETAAAAGVLRAVAFAAGRAVTVKRVAGPPRLRDLLREYFVGCAAVLVRVAPGGAASSVPPADGVADLPLLEPDAPADQSGEASGEAWRVVQPDAAALRLTTAKLVARLRRPRPWSSGS